MMLGYIYCTMQSAQSLSVLDHETQCSTKEVMAKHVFHGKGCDVQFTISSTHSSCQKRGSTPICGEKLESRILKGD